MAVCIDLWKWTATIWPLGFVKMTRDKCFSWKTASEWKKNMLASKAPIDNWFCVCESTILTEWAVKLSLFLTSGQLHSPEFSYFSFLLWTTPLSSSCCHRTGHKENVSRKLYLSRTCDRASALQQPRHPGFFSSSAWDISVLSFGLHLYSAIHSLSRKCMAVLSKHPSL